MSSLILYPAILLNLQAAAVLCIIPPINGRYTTEIDDFRLTVPSKISENERSFHIPHFFAQDWDDDDRRRRSPSGNKDMVRYFIGLDDAGFHVELWPNYGLLAPGAIAESLQPNTRVQDKKLTRLDNTCHFTGRVRGIPGSKVALSACDGLAGYVAVDGQRFFIEPLQDHEPNNEGQHLHVIYKRESGSWTSNQCGTSSNWQDAWKKRFREEFQNHAASPTTVTRRGTASVHRYLETLVVCDKKFLEHHRKIDIQTYVLTIMNMVADYYHDSTSGNQMDVVVVRVMYLEKEEEEIDLVINRNAEDTLASFCKWQQKINPQDKANPNHHDIAVLLTRYDICADNMSNCGLMGLAYVATACTANEPCAINEDGGLVLGIVVAHEMGHVMGCSHDKEGESPCAPQDTDKSFFVMAPFVHLFTTRWSACSRGFLTSLFENNLGECLNDEPEISLFKDSNMLPGTVYDAEQQCQLLFPDSKVCPMKDNNFCEMLLCQNTPTSCLSNDEPPADGTKCGENMWCYRKKCVEMGERPEAVNGGWGEWGPFSECSRTCGGGVTIASRECNNPTPAHRGRYCLGDRKKIKTCNTDACPAGAPSYREIQCRDHNSKPFKGKLLKWTPYLMADNPCVLYCLNNENSFAKLEPRVKDGTRCRAGTKDMCVSGTCKKVGCDEQIDSDAVEDVCGICNGDGTQCQIIDETYRDPPGRGYVKISTVPTGSRNLVFEEMDSSENSIAVGDHAAKKYFLNGGYSEQGDGDVNFGDFQGVYTHPESNKEKLIVKGPLTQDLVLSVVFYKPENVGYRYKYALPSTDATYTPKYHWEQDEWEECSIRCGGGFHQAKYTCVEERAGKVSEKFCQNMDKPDGLKEPCNQKPCQTKWKTGRWGQCHACKFKSGVRIREVECVRESPHPGQDDILVEDSECRDKKPGTRELCNSHKTCKSRRFTDGLPDDLMEDVWRQIHHILDRRAWPDDTESCGKSGGQSGQSGQSEKSGEKKSKTKLKVGQMVKDRVPQNEIKLIEVPLKQSHMSADLSDAEFETMGDQVADSVDTKKARIATGAAAAKLLQEMQHENETATTEKKPKHN